MKKFLFNFVLTAVILAAFLYAFIQFTRNKDTAITKNPLPSMSIEGFSITAYDNNGTTKVFDIKGRRMQAKRNSAGPFLLELSRSFIIENALMTFYENDTPVSTIRAQEADPDMPFTSHLGMSIKSMEFTGSASVITEDRKFLTCDKISWNKETNRIYGRGHCVAADAGKLINADIITADVKLAEIQPAKDKHKRLRFKI